ncbi:MAG TPA: isoleucine--tRNA ligase [Solirubrobacteraceae bacterium]
MTALERHPLIPPRKVDPQQALPALEEEVLHRWRERDVFAQSLRMREGAEPWVFYEGPPTANGRPGSHHVLSRVFKDIYPRYKTMRGHRVERKGGWDCHGLPVEIAVEQQLGISSKAEIEEYGIERFNAKCRESVFTYLEEWNRLTERIGFWIDLDDAYRTLDESYIESVWWALAEIDRRGLLYEGHKVVPFCTRCGTALSSHEVALGYRDVVDRAVYVRLPLRPPADTRERSVGAGDALLIWTTTPWTLPGNVAVAVGADIEYVRARYRGETLILAAALVERVLGEEAEILDRFPGSALLGLTYEGPIFATGSSGPFPIVAGDFVNVEDGTGIVHLAPAFGEDDFDAALANGLFDPADPQTLFNPVRRDGTYDGRVRGHDGRSFEGRYVKDPALTEELVAELNRHGLLFRVGDYEHSYPHCWRCGTPLIYYAKASWYIRTTAVRERMLEVNETVAWHPPHIKHGRFGDWLQNNVDWALSRERYWGTPLPIWRCPTGHVLTVGSFAELRERSGRTLADHHRPYVDEIELPCPQCAQAMRRVPEVIDVWFDSGAMPFAQHHAPLEHEQRFRERFPADFVCEALDQTRGWFYSLLAVSTLLFDASPYRNVVCLGLILDAEGQKMSKSKGNAVEPWQVIETYGADAFRWYFFTSKQPWDGYRFSQETIADGVRLFLKQLWSTYFFYVLYAHANTERLSAVTEEPDFAATESTVAADADLDRWALSVTTATAQLVTDRLDAYDATGAGRAIAELVDELSNWYVRRSRRRFWDGDPQAFQTLRHCLLTISRLLAPFCPFIADELYDNLDGTLASVHLCDFPTAADLAPRDLELEEAMAIARQTVRLGLAARGQAKIKVRQPLREAVVVAAGRERAAIERLADTVREELNVRQIRFVSGAQELGGYEVKANYRRLGPLFGKQMPLVAQAIAALDPAQVALALQAEDDAETHLGISVAGHEHTLTAQDVILTMRAPEGYSVEREGAHAVALDLTIDDELRRDGRAREIVRAVQNARKNAGLAIEDRIELWLSGDAALIDAASEHAASLAAETLATSLSLEDGDDATASHREHVSIDGLSLTIALMRPAQD